MFDSLILSYLNVIDAASPFLKRLFENVPMDFFNNEIAKRSTHKLRVNDFTVNLKF